MTILVNDSNDDSRHNIEYVQKIYDIILDSVGVYGYVLDRKLVAYDFIVGAKSDSLKKAKSKVALNSVLMLGDNNIDLVSKSIDECLVNNKVVRLNFIETEDDKKVYYQTVISPLNNDKAIMMVYVINNNITYMKSLIDAKLKATEEAQNMINYFSNMSHEIRTPLNAICGFSDLLVNETDTEMQNKYVKIIKSNTNMLLTLVDEVLNLSRMESGKTEMVFVSVRMNEFVDELAQVHMSMMPKGVKLKVVKPENKTVIFHTDRNRLMEVMFNFMSNAIKHTKKGSITITLAVKNKELILSVSDTGEGILKEKQPLIFERFVKADENSSGTGLGLPICQAIVKRLGGRIEFQSEYGKGSIFSVLFPYNK